LEDVYTYNDFSNTILEPDQTPHLVTEFSGHMFPTKTFDQEETTDRTCAAAYADTKSELGMSKIAGAIGGARSNYNTHREFGSGDRICYHGVMDIFRLPNSPLIFMKARFRRKSGWYCARRRFGQTETGAKAALTRLRFLATATRLSFSSARKIADGISLTARNFPNLQHPPFVVRGINFWSFTWQPSTDLRVVGYIKAKKLRAVYIGKRCSSRAGIESR